MDHILARHLASAGIGATLGAGAGISIAFQVAPETAVYLSVVNGPIGGGLGLMAGLLSPGLAATTRRCGLQLMVAVLVAVLAGGCAHSPPPAYVDAASHEAAGQGHAHGRADITVRGGYGMLKGAAAARMQARRRIARPGLS